MHGQRKTYYHTKDIAWLSHEPLLHRFREQRAYEKRVTKAKARQNAALAARLAGRRPGYTLDHLVRQRYPSFVDALRDLDDPLRCGARERGWGWGAESGLGARAVSVCGLLVALLGRVCRLCGAPRTRKRAHTHHHPGHSSSRTRCNYATATRQMLLEEPLRPLPPGAGGWARPPECWCCLARRGSPIVSQRRRRDLEPRTFPMTLDAQA